MTIGYIRVSTADQNPARQEEALRQHGVERVFEEKISGKDMNRPKLKGASGFREGGRHCHCRILFSPCQINKGSSLHHRQASGEESVFRLPEREHRYDNSSR